MDRHTNSGDGLISSTQIHCGTACPSSCSCASQDGIIFVQHEVIVVCPGEEIRPRKRIYKGLLCNNFIFAQRICRWISHLTMMVGGGEGGSVRWRVWVRITGFIREIMACPSVLCPSEIRAVTWNYYYKVLFFLRLTITIDDIWRMDAIDHFIQEITAEE